MKAVKQQQEDAQKIIYQDVVITDLSKEVVSLKRSVEEQRADIL